LPTRHTGISDKADDSLVGQVLAEKYRIRDVLARGGMGRIYRAEQIPLGRTVVIKVLSLRFAVEEDPGFKDRFYLEAAVLAKLKHQNTVTVFDYGMADDETLYMVMEYVEGRTLAQVLRTEGALEPERALRFGYEIARSLDEAHANGIIHRDLKPSNVMVVPTDEGEAIKVLDFGIVKVLEDTGIDTITRPDRMVGSPRYMAPEQIRKGDIDGRTDLYAVGVMLYEMITNRPPFKGKTSVKTLMSHVQDPVPPMAEKTDRSIPLPVEQLVLRCLQKKPENRFPDTAAFKRAVRSVLMDIGATPLDTLDTSGEYSAPTEPLDPDGDSTTLSTAPPDLSTGPKWWPRWLTFLFAGLVVLLFAVSTVAGWITFNSYEGGQPVAPEEATPARPPLVLPTPTTKTTVPAPPRDPNIAYKNADMWVSSEPDNAEVWEGGKLWGTTPLVIRLGLLPDEATRVFEVRAPGYQPYEVSQGPSPRDVEVHAILSHSKPTPVQPKPEPKPDIRIER
jgi:serine/threonine-protein kinase